jgi:hypothetical protein
MAGCIFANDLI